MWRNDLWIRGDGHQRVLVKLDAQNVETTTGDYWKSHFSARLAGTSTAPSVPTTGSRANETRTKAILLAKAFARGFPISALQALGVLMTTRGSLWGVLIAGFAINFWWQHNVKAVKDGTNPWAFAVGSACGSVLTVWLLR